MKKLFDVLIIGVFFLLFSIRLSSYLYSNLGNTQLLALSLPTTLIDYCIVDTDFQAFNTQHLRTIQANYKTALNISERNFPAILHLGLSYCLSLEFELAKELLATIPDDVYFANDRYLFFQGLQSWMLDDKPVAAAFFAETSWGWPFLREQIQYALRNGDKGKALLWANVVTATQLNKEGAQQMASFYVQLEQQEKAAVVWEDFASSLPDKNASDYWLALAEAAYLKGETANARERYEQGLLVADMPYIFYERLGVLESTLGNWDKALIYFRESLRSNPDYIYSYIYIGDVLIELGDIQGSMASYERFNEISTSNATGYLKQAAIQLQNLRFAQAKNSAQLAMEQEPQNAQAYYYLSQSYYGLGKKLDAIESLKNATILYSDSDWLLLLGSWYEEIGLVNEAVMTYEQILEVEPDFEAALIKLESLKLVNP